MANKEYGIVLTAKDQASAAVKKLSGAMGATTKAVERMGSLGARAFSGISIAIITVNQGVELLKSAFGAVSGFVGGSIEAVRELRTETNPLVLEMDRLATNSLRTKAALGTAFASALLGISKAFSSVGSGAADFLDKNRKLIATRIVQFLFKIAQALNSGIGEALQLANTVWATMNSVVDESIISLSGWAQTMFKVLKFINRTEGAQIAFGKAIKDLDKVQADAKTRMEGNIVTHGQFADQIEAVRVRIQELIKKGYKPAMAAAKAFAEAAGPTAKETPAQRILRLRNQITRLIPELNKATKAFVEGLGAEAGVKKLEGFRSKLDSVTRRLALTGTEGIGPLRDEMEMLYAQIGRPVSIDIDLGDLAGSVEAVQMFGDTLTDALDTAVKSYESLALEAEMAEIASQAMFDAWAQFPAMLSDLATVAVDVFEGIAMGTLSMGEAWGVMSLTALKSVLSLVRQTVIAFSIQAAAAQFAATSTIPFGILISGALAGASLAFVEAMLSKIPQPEGFAQGGLVTGGTANQDSVPAMLMPGEFVLTKQQTESLRKGNTSLVGGSNVTIQMTSQIPPTRAEMKKFVRQNILPALRDLKSQGMA